MLDHFDSGLATANIHLKVFNTMNGEIRYTLDNFHFIHLRGCSLSRDTPFGNTGDRCGQSFGHLARSSFSGDYTCGETLVPIPNTIDKPARPMIVPTSAKVGHRRNPTKERSVTEKLQSVFSCAETNQNLGNRSPDSAIQIRQSKMESAMPSSRSSVCMLSSRSPLLLPINYYESLVRKHVGLNVF